MKNARKPISPVSRVLLLLAVTAPLLVAPLIVALIAIGAASGDPGHLGPTIGSF